MKFFSFLTIIFLSAASFSVPESFVHAEEASVTQDARVNTSSASFVTRVAPGEFLPIAIELVNFGGGRRVDVLVHYDVVSADGEVIVTANETVAVETTAKFIKTLQIPLGMVPGSYVAKTSVTYEGQLVPATTQLSFTVERKILGFFTRDFLLYGGIIFFLSIATFFIGRLFIRRQRTTRFAMLDYSNISPNVRTFYEILSDTIIQMRQKVGDEALVIALGVDGLSVDSQTGRVLNLTQPPAKVIAALVAEYERILGKKVSFSFRQKKLS